MNIKDAVDFLSTQVPNPNAGLPNEIFCYASSITPLINVDLLINDERGRTLLSWRNDKYAGTGWHVPGGIIRFQETFESRLLKVAMSEIGIKVDYDKTPIAINELIHPEQKTRGHFISLLYQCYLSDNYIPENNGLLEGDAGFLAWHRGCPGNLITYHEIYREIIDKSY